MLGADLESRADAIAQLLRGHASTLGNSLDLETMFIRSCT